MVNIFLKYLGPWITNILLGGMLTNADGCINVTKQDLPDLEKPDIVLLKSVFDSTASKVYMMLDFSLHCTVRFVVTKNHNSFILS